MGVLQYTFYDAPSQPLSDIASLLRADKPPP
jgi:hypothetical protein